MHGVSFKKRAPRAIKEIREFAVKAMVSFSFSVLSSVVVCLLACKLFACVWESYKVLSCVVGR